MLQPLLPWESKDTTHPDLVWRIKLDNKYLIEVHRTGSHSGKLVIFDHIKNDREIACWDVRLLYGAKFGPDIDDVAEWKEKVLDFIDNTYNKQ